MQIKFKKLSPMAIAPLYATMGAACFDLHTVEANIVLPGGYTGFKTGLAFEIPEGYVMMIYSRSGHGFKNGIRLSNCVGIIDSDYRGEVAVSIRNDGHMPFRVDVGTRIAQAMIMPVPMVGLIEAVDLSSTARGANGFGSTGQ